MRLPLALLLGLLATSPAQAQIASVEPAPAIGALFNSATVAGSPQSVDLAAQGYVEREFFIRGTARAGSADAPVGPPLPYVTRIVLRMPADPRRWTGVVHVEPIHPQLGGTTHWWVIQNWAMRRGDAYVAMALGDDVGTRTRSADGGPPLRQSETTRWFNPERYAALSWPDDDGIRMAVMADIVARLRDHPAGVLPRAPRTVLAAGWSFTGSFLRTYINGGFHEARRRADGGPLIDGYLVGISSRWNSMGMIPFTSAQPSVAMDDERRALRPIDAPVIEFLTEFEVASGDGPQRPDSDARIGAHRLYELGGVIHSDALLPGGREARMLRPNLVQLASRGYPAERMGADASAATCPWRSSDLPHGALARAVTANLLRWAQGGTPPPHAPELALAGRDVVHDARGNPVGGVRPAELELPLAVYGAPPAAERGRCGSRGTFPLFVSRPLAATDARALYGTRARYMARYRRAVAALVRQGWLLQADVPALIAGAQARANALLPQ
jgi:hypothetical protein